MITHRAVRVFHWFQDSLARASALVVTALVFYGVVTPTGLLMRAFRKDPMSRRFDRRASTYWIAHPRDPDPQRYLQQG